MLIEDGAITKRDIYVVVLVMLKENQLGHHGTSTQLIQIAKHWLFS